MQASDHPSDEELLPGKPEPEAMESRDTAAAESPSDEHCVKKATPAPLCVAGHEMVLLFAPPSDPAMAPRDDGG